MSYEGRAREVKVVLLGESGVGKSSLVLRFVTNNFKTYNESTIGASFMSKVLSHDGKQIKFQIWDTAGQEKYHSLAPMYYRGAAAAIVVYDITKLSSFNTLKNWIEELKAHGPKDIVIAIAGNKADLASIREVDRTVAETYATEIGATYLETSAKDDVHVHHLFLEISERLPKPQLLSGTDTRPQATLSSTHQHPSLTLGGNSHNNNTSTSTCC